MATFYLDSCVLIYLHEGPTELASSLAGRLFPSISPPTLCVSELTRLECRVVPVRTRDAELLAEYDAFFALPALLHVPLSRTVFDRATHLRADRGLKTPDALHLAAAIEAGCDEFWTNDLRLRGATDEVRIVGIR